MEISIFLAKAFSIYFLVLAVAMLANREYFQAAALDTLKNKSGLALLTSIITLILGILLVLFHNVWVAGWPIIITIIAWMTLVKGLIRSIFPKQMQRWSNIIKNNNFYTSTVIIMILLGIYLAYLGFLSSI